MGRKAGRAPIRASTSMKPNEFQPLNEEEVLFLWKGLVDEGKLSPSKLQQFMQQVAGVSITGVQLQDLLTYMAGNTDGRVGRDDFKNFLSIGRLADTDPKSFMWEPRAKYVQDPHLRSHASESGGESHPERRQSGPTANMDAPEPKPVVAPETKAPSKRRPQPLKKSSVGPEHEIVEGPSSEATVSTFKAQKPPPMSAEAEAKIQQALLKYEQQSWDKFNREEKMFRRHLFEQFAGAGEDEMDVTEYHRMLMKWFPLAAWSAPRTLRAPDSIAALEYVRRRDLEGKGVSYVPAQHEEATTPQHAEGSADAPALLVEAKMPYGLWLDVMNGKHRPEEHYTDYRYHHAQV